MALPSLGRDKVMTGFGSRALDPGNCFIASPEERLCSWAHGWPEEEACAGAAEEGVRCLGCEAFLCEVLASLSHVPGLSLQPVVSGIKLSLSFHVSALAELAGCLWSAVAVAGVMAIGTCLLLIVGKIMNFFFFCGKLWQWGREQRKPIHLVFVAYFVFEMLTKQPL